MTDALPALIEFPADDPERARAFWTGVLGVELAPRPKEAGAGWESERDGLRLAAPDGRPFPPRAQPGGVNLRLQQLIFSGHFDDAASQSCVPDRLERCRNTFVVSTYDGLVH